MTSTVTTHWNGATYQLRPEKYWHGVRSDSHLLHNVHLGEGVTHSISFHRKNGEHAVSPYGFVRGPSPKETSWDETRKAIAPDAPTRVHALFLFDEERIARDIVATWFVGEDRTLLKARVDLKAKILRVDARWLDAHEPQWTANASRYWRGEMTADPRPEIIVEGAVYFPDWRDPPFGKFAGLMAGQK
jgi:hypothetical protein